MKNFMQNFQGDFEKLALKSRQVIVFFPSKQSMHHDLNGEDDV